MFDFVTDVMLEPTELEKSIKTFTTNICAKISEKQEELILTTIQTIGGDEFIDITIDKEKVIEALTDYVNKQKGVPNIEVRHGEWVYVRYYGHGECYAICSVCKSEVKTLHPTALRIFNRYCPYCGAKMDGEPYIVIAKGNHAKHLVELMQKDDVGTSTERSDT